MAAADQLEGAILDDIDTSILENDEMLSIFTPTELLRLPTKIKDRMFDRIPSTVGTMAEEADLDSDPDSLFEDLESSLSSVLELFDGDTSVADLVNSAYEQIEEAREEFRQRRSEYFNAPDEDWDWQNYSPGERPGRPRPASREAVRAITENEGPPRPRSIFSDVDD